MKIVYPGYTGKIIKVRKELTYGFGLDPTRWTLTRSIGTSTIETAGAYDPAAPNPNAVIIRFNYNASTASGNWTFSTTSATAQTITLTWMCYACHSWYRPTANTYFWRGTTGSNVGTILSGYAGCYTYVSGTTTFAVTAGQAWGIYVSGRNNDSSRIVSGFIEIYDSTTPIEDFYGNQDNETLINSNNVTLQNWLEASNGYVVYWYDQSPNALHLYEDTLSFQPQINKVNNSIVFNNSRLNRGGVLAQSTSSYTYLATFKLNSLLNNQVIMEHSLGALTTNRRASMMSVNGSLYFAGQSNDLANIVSLTTTGFNKTIISVNKSVNPVINVRHNSSSYSGNTAIPANLNIGTDWFLLGVNATRTNEYFNGEIKYIVVINGAPDISKTVSFFDKIQSTGTTYSLQSSGAISLSDVNTFLNRGNTSLIKFSDLYRASGTLIGGLANLTAPNIPITTGNAISLNNLRGASRIG